jgi:geranylgeranyl pyrophosphate synthase
MKCVSVLLVVLMIARWAPSQSGQPLSQEDYDKLTATALKELKDNPEKITKASKAVLAKSANLDPADELMEIFDIDPIFTVESMLLLLATHNGIKKDESFISDYADKTREVSQKIKRKSPLTFLAVMAAKLVSENRTVVSIPKP